METLAGLPDLSIRQLSYLVAVADAPTWAAAAARLGVSASALSQGLAELERRVGLTLFEPAGRRRVLRASAAPVLDHARRVVGLTRDLVHWSDQMRSARRGRVRLGMIDVAAVHHFAAVVRAFRDERTEVDVTLAVAPSAALLDGVRDGDLDLVVCVEPPTEPVGIDTEPVLDEALVVIAPGDEEVGPPADWGPWALFPNDSHTRQRVETRLVALGAPVRIAAESHQPDVLVQMVALGFGWTVLPADAVADRDDVTIGPELVTRRLMLAVRAGSVPDAAVDELAKRLRAQAAVPR